MLQKSLLWQVLAGGKAPVSYLFGTMHVSGEQAFRNVQKAGDALSDCSAFYAEIDLEKAATSISIEDYYLPSGETLESLVGNKKYTKYRHIIMKAFGLDLNFFREFLPIIIVNRIAESLLEQEEGMAVDQFLWQKADSMSLRMGGLESVDEQIRTLKALDLNVQLKMLKEAASHVNAFRKHVGKLAECYGRQDIELLHKMTRKDMGVLRNALIYQRNERMANSIHEYLGESSFFAVGAAHLAGKKGMLALLKRKGLKLRAV